MARTKKFTLHLYGCVDRPALNDHHHHWQQHDNDEIQATINVTICDLCQASLRLRLPFFLVFRISFESHPVRHSAVGIANHYLLLVADVAAVAADDDCI